MVMSGCWVVMGREGVSDTNEIRALQGSVEQSLGKMNREELAVIFREQGLLSCVQSWLNYFHRRSMEYILCQIIPLLEYAKAECMLAPSGIAPL